MAAQLVQSINFVLWKTNMDFWFFFSLWVPSLGETQNVDKM